MKENVIDVLLYLFENYIDTDDNNKPDQQTLENELEQVGFPEPDIRRAFEWLDNMVVIAEGEQPALAAATLPSIRHYTAEEKELLNVECQGYLLFLEQIGVLDEATREVVIDRVTALQTKEIDITQLKWVILMVLFYQPDREVAYAWMEDLVFEDLEAVIH